MRTSLLVFALCATIQAATSPNDPSSVLVLIQDNTGPEAGTGGANAGQFVADYYINARGIPAANVLHISTCVINSMGACCSPGGDCLLAHTSSTNIAWQEYLDNIQTPIVNKLAANGGALASSIKYIVPTYGIPLSLISRPGTPFAVDHLSIDSQISALNQPSEDSGQYNTNPYYQVALFGNPTSRPSHLYQLNFANKFYSVARIDGPSAVISTGLVDKAILAEKGINVRGTGYFDWQGIGMSPNSGTQSQRADGNIYNANTLCQARFQCVINNQSVTGTTFGNLSNILWFWGWYYEPDGRVWTFANGAVGSVLISDSAYKIRDGVGQFWVPTMLAAGITAAWGVTSEPFAVEYPLGNTLLNHLWNGYTFGESCSMATPHTGWMGICVGDPLYYPLRWTGPNWIGPGVNFKGGFH